MKTSLMRSVAASALLVGATIAIPVTGYVGQAVAQSKDSTTTQTAPKPAAPKNDTQAAPATSGSDSSDSTGTTGQNSSDTMKPANNNSAGDATKAPADNTASSSSSGEKIVTEQKDNEVLASTYIGQSVYNSNDKSIGDISDLVFDKNGGIKAAVIGVGGFLGIGQKDVAVAFDRIKIQRKPNSADVKLVTDMTAEQLKKAPAFKNLQAKMDEQNASKPAPAAGGATGAGGAAMGTGGAAGGAGSAGGTSQ